MSKSEKKRYGVKKSGSFYMAIRAKHYKKMNSAFYLAAHSSKLAAIFL